MESRIVIGYILLGGAILLVVAWLNQPYFGTRFCLADGIKTTEDYIEEIHAYGLTAIEAQMDWLESQGLQEEELSKIKMQRESLLREATRMVSMCAGERDIRYCRYMGPDSKVLMGGQMLESVPAEQADNYRFIVSTSNLEVSLVPYREKSLFLFGYSHNKEAALCSFNSAEMKKWREESELDLVFDVCGFGCFCDEY
ncbi:hypothetical protein ABVF61_08030 [Roseibium sp. HPY-6]|uniref:hypothetical protein n=1 Tax=Roseibium sp. HPY-6 TaxID=3229852 RepID=UPI00338F358C